jgi:hypothetical protein
MLDIGAGANMMSLKFMQHGLIGMHVVSNIKEYPKKTVHIDIVVVDVLDVSGILLSRKFGAMIGGSLEMYLTFLRLPLKDGTVERLLNVPITGDNV